MSTDCQSYFGLRNPSDHIEKTHEFYTLYYLFQIFKELNPSYLIKMMVQVVLEFILLI